MKIPTVDVPTRVPSAQAVTVPIDAFTGPVDELIKTSQMVADASLQGLEKVTALDVQNHKGKIAEMSNQLLVNKQLTAKEGAPGFSADYGRSFDKMADDYVNSDVVSPLARHRLRNSLQSVKADKMTSAYAYERTSRDAYGTRILSENSNAINNRLVTDPDYLPNAESDMTSLHHTARTVLDATQAEKFIGDSTKQMYESAATGLVNKDPAKFLQEAKHGMWQDVDADKMAVLTQKATAERDKQSVLVLSQYGSRDPMSFSHEAATGRFKDPAVKGVWDSLDAEGQQNVLTHSITIANQTRNYQDAVERRGERSQRERSNQLAIKFQQQLGDGDLEGAKKSLDEVRRVGSTTFPPSTFGEMTKSLAKADGHGGEVDPAVVDNVRQLIHSNDFEVNPLDYVGQGLDRKTATSLAKEQQSLKGQRYRQARDYLKSAIGAPDKIDVMNETAKRYLNGLKDLQDKYDADPTVDPMQHARDIVGSLNDDKAKQTSINMAKGTLKREVPRDILVMNKNVPDFEATRAKVNAARNKWLGSMDQATADKIERAIQAYEQDMQSLTNPGVKEPTSDLPDPNAPVVPRGTR
jgi:hypothetical protein